MRYFVIQIIITLVKLFQSEIPIIFHMNFSIKFSRSGLYQLKHTNTQTVRPTKTTTSLHLGAFSTSLIPPIDLEEHPLTVFIGKIVSSDPEVTHRFLTLDDLHPSGHIQSGFSILIG